MSDPVCGMDVAVSPASIRLDVDGERYYFCREECRDSFAAERAPMRAPTDSIVMGMAADGSP